MLTQSSVVFRWEVCIDPDPNDFVSYTIWFESGGDSIGYYTGGVTQFYVNIYSIPVVSPQSITQWYVTAHSSFPDFDLECEERFTFVAPLGVEEHDENSGIPDEYVLMPAYPNPFNASVNLSFGLPEKSGVRISICDITGREVHGIINEELSAGYHSVKWDAENYVSGIYFVRLISDGGENRVMKIVLLK